MTIKMQTDMISAIAVDSTSRIALIFVQQIGLLAVVALALATLSQRDVAPLRRYQNAFAGVVLGLGAVFGMAVRSLLVPDMLLDAPTVFMAVSGAFFGPLSALLTGLVSASYQWWVGGETVGAALFITAAVGFISVGYHAYLIGSGRSFAYRDIPILIAAATLAHFSSFQSLANGFRTDALADLALPLVLRTLIGISLLGAFLIEERRRREMRTALAAAATHAREQAEQIRESEAQYRLLAENMNDVVIYVAAEGDHRYVSPAASKLLGFKPDEARADLLISHVHPGDQARLEEGRAALAMGAIEIWRGSFRVAHQDSRWIWMEADVRGLRSETGERTGFVGVLRDISERVGLEDRLRDAQKAQVAAQISGGVAHYFNNLLLVIQGNAEVLQEEITTPQHSELASQIQLAAERAADLTGKLLAFGSKRALVLEPIDIAAALQSMEPRLRPMLGSDIELSVLAEGPLVAQTDSRQLEIAIENLVRNSCEGMPSGGRLTITGGRRQGLTRPGGVGIEGPAVFIVITDTGSGIAPDLLSRVAEPFFTTKEVGEGYGLGLSVVQGLAQQSGGHVTITSEVGLGTTVEIVLPAPQDVRTRSLADSR